MKLYAEQMERCLDCIKRYPGQIEFDLLQIELDLRQMKRDVLRIEFEEEQIKRVFPCLVFSRSALFSYPVYMECRESGVAAPRCLLIFNNK